MTIENLLQDAFIQLKALRETLELIMNDDNFEIDDLQNIAENINDLSVNISS